MMHSQGDEKQKPLEPFLGIQWSDAKSPLSASLGGLKAIIFTPPAGLLSFDYGQGEQTHSLPQRNEPREISYALMAYDERSNGSLSFSPDFLENTRVLPESSRQLISLPLRILSRSLEFVFEDGRSYFLLETMQDSSLPDFLNPNFYLRDTTCDWKRQLGPVTDDYFKLLLLNPTIKRNQDIKKTWLIALEILAWAIKRQIDVGDLEVLYAESSTLPKRQVSRLDHIFLAPETTLAVSITNDPEMKSSLRLRLWERIPSPGKPGTLRIRATSLRTELERYFLGSGSSDVYVRTSDIQPNYLELQTIRTTREKAEWKTCFVSFERDSLVLERSLRKLEEALGEDLIIFSRRVQVSGEEFKPKILIQESENTLQFAASFRLGDSPYIHLDLPTSYSYVLSPLLGSLDQVTKVDRTLFASKKKEYRTNDLLLLRHQGLTLFCLFEMSNWMIHQKLTTGETLTFTDDINSPEADRQFDLFFTHLQAMIPALLGHPGIKLTRLVSPETRGLLLEFIERLYLSLMHDRSITIGNSALFEISEARKQILPLISFIIQHLAETAKGNLFTRPQSPIGETLRESLRSWTDGRIISDESASDLQWPSWIDLGLYDSYSVTLLMKMAETGVDIELNGMPLLSVERPFEFSFKIKDVDLKDDYHWFDLHPEIFFNGERVPPQEVKLNFGQGDVGFIEYQGRVYRIDKKLLPAYRSLQSFWDKLKDFQEHDLSSNSRGVAYRVNRSQTLELFALKKQGFKIEAQGEWAQVFDYFENGLGKRDVELPESVRGRLLPHQQQGAQWLHDLYELRLGAVLGDEMGLGKTFQILAFLSSLQARNRLGRTLIVVPTSLVYNWLDEKTQFTPDLPAAFFRPEKKEELGSQLASGNSCILLTTYGLLTEHDEFFKRYAWNIVVFDEAQNLKNISSQRSVLARDLDARFKVCVTGTPMENNFVEFYSLCELVVPGALGDISWFRKQYSNLNVRESLLNELRLVTKPILLRRTKREINLALPEKRVNTVHLPFTPDQLDLYKKMALTFSRQVDDLIRDGGERKAQFAMFSALMRLRQICSDPSSVPGVEFKDLPVKVDHILSSIQEHVENGESVIIFTQFLSTLNRLAREFKSRRLPFSVIQGSVSTKARAKIISAFQDGQKPSVLIMTLKTGGVGLNLTKASVVYHIEPWWNPAVENQATDRAHRMGQTKEVKVYNLLIEGSLEEKIEELKLKKQKAFEQLFGDQEDVPADQNESVTTGLTREDFDLLLR